MVVKEVEAPNDEALYTIAEVANRLRVNEKTVRNWILAGEIEVVVLPNGYYRIPQSTLNALLQKRKL